MAGKWTGRDALGVDVIVAPAVVGLWAGHGGGIDWVGGYPHQRFLAVAGVWVCASVIPLIPAGILGVAAPRWRWLGVGLLIVATVASLMLGFALATGVGGEDGVSLGDAPGVAAGRTFLASIGAIIGFVIGSLLRGAPTSASRAGASAHGPGHHG